MSAFVGRDGIWVADPHGPYASLLGPAAQSVHDRALVIGTTLSQLTDAQLEERSSAVGKPFERITEEEVVTGLAMHRRERVLAHTVLVAEERARLIQDGYVSDDVSPNQHAADVEDAWKPYNEAVEARRTFIESVAETPDYYMAQQFLTWPDDRERAAEAFAIQREEAFRAKRAEIGRDPSAAVALPAGVVLTEIGTGDVSEAEERLRIDAAETLERLDAPTAARRVAPEEITVPNSLDRLEVILGKERVADMKVRIGGLEDLLRSAPDSYVIGGHREHGSPEKLVDPEARRAIYLERRIATNEALVARFDNEAAFVGSYDPEFAKRQWIEAQRTAFRVLADKSKLEALQKSGPHPRGELQRVGNDVLRAAAFENASEFKRRRGIAQEVERSIANPSRGLQELVGPRLDPGHELHDKWVDTVRELETDRLSTKSAQDRGLDPPAAKTPLEAERLHQQMNELRTVHGMPELEQARSRGIGAGIGAGE